MPLRWNQTSPIECHVVSESNPSYSSIFRRSVYLVPTLVSDAVREDLDVGRAVVDVVQADLILPPGGLQLQVGLVSAGEGQDRARIAILLLQRRHDGELTGAAQQGRSR